MRVLHPGPNRVLLLLLSETETGKFFMIDETALRKGQLRKLRVLRKSLGPAIADGAFAKWLDQAVEEPKADENLAIIADALWSLIQEGRLSIRRGGYIVRRGRGRVIVEDA